MRRERERGSYLVHSSIHKTKWQSGFACLRHSRRKSSNYTHTHTHREGVPCVCVGLVCRCVSVCCCLVVLFLGICTWVNGHLAVTQYAAHENCNQCAGYFHSPRHIVVATRYMSIILLYIYNCLFTGLISSLFVQSLLLFFVGLWGFFWLFLAGFTCHMAGLERAVHAAGQQTR